MPSELQQQYDKVLSTGYDDGSPAFVYNWKRLAFAAAGLKQGDSVIVFCCGTGRDFPLLMEHIGPEGRIVGMDFSAGMLERARQMVEKQQWQNVTLMQADILEMPHLGEHFDAAVCTLGISTIPDCNLAYEKIVQHVKPGGTVVIGDYQWITGWRAFFNPVVLYFCRKFGGSSSNHKGSLEIFRRMHRELRNIREQQFFMHAYRYCIGQTESG
jgi:ubiquinone/menaquinone biosynthesis C-methylase UbiE